MKGTRLLGTKTRTSVEFIFRLKVLADESRALNVGLRKNISCCRLVFGRHCQKYFSCIMPTLLTLCYEQKPRQIFAKSVCTILKTQGVFITDNLNVG